MPTPDDSWYFTDADGRTAGPVPAADLLERIREGAVQAQTPVSRDGASWTPAATVPELGFDCLVLDASGGALNVVGPFARPYFDRPDVREQLPPDGAFFVRGGSVAAPAGPAPAEPAPAAAALADRLREADAALRAGDARRAEAEAALAAASHSFEAERGTLRAEAETARAEAARLETLLAAARESGERTARELDEARAAQAALADAQTALAAAQARLAETDAALAAARKAAETAGEEARAAGQRAAEAETARAEAETARAEAEAARTAAVVDLDALRAEVEAARAAAAQSEEQARSRDSLLHQIGEMLAKASGGAGAPAVPEPAQVPTAPETPEAPETRENPVPPDSPEPAVEPEVVEAEVVEEPAPGNAAPRPRSPQAALEAQLRRELAMVGGATSGSGNPFSVRIPKKRK